MSLALATKGVLPDFTGTGTGTGPSTTVYVLEEFDVEVAHDGLDIEITQPDDVSLDISEISVEIDVGEEESAAVSVTDSDIVDITIEIGGIVAPQPVYYSLWDDETIPSNVSQETDHVNLGVKFKSTVDGYITAIRFYKDVTNVSLHTGSLWTAAGVSMGSVVFTGETASGWQEMAFPAPISIDADIIYVASYHTQGYYSYDFGYFEFAYENLPLSAPASSDVSGNGVFTYDSGIVFPASSFNQGNYWIDIVFTQQL